MNRIPPEILCDIFLAALPHPTDPNEYLSSVLAPLHISHVCRTWRTVSLSFGELWSYLCIDYSAWSRGRIPGKRRIDLEAMLYVFETWIDRTNGAPLNFRVKFYHSSFHNSNVHAAFDYIIAIMITEQHRWRDVALSWWPFLMPTEFPEFPINLTGMPLLTSLELLLVFPPRTKTKISIARSSRLRRLDICATDVDLMTGEEPLCHLTEAEIAFCRDGSSGGHALRTWLDVLRAAPFLTEFITDFYRYTDGPPLPRAQNEPLIQLPNLRVLKLLHDHDEYDPTSFVIDYVTLPNLRVLFFVSNSYDKDVKAEMLSSFFRRSLPSLTTLVINWDTVHEEAIIPILHLLPTLKYLRLEGATVTRRFFHALTLPSNTDSLLGVEHAAACPVLETLFLLYVSFEQNADSWVALVAMLKSRPGGLGKSDVIYLRDANENIVSATVKLSELDENIGESRSAFKEYVQGGGVVIGDYEALDSLLINGSWQVALLTFQLIIQIINPLYRSRTLRRDVSPDP